METPAIRFSDRPSDALCVPGGTFVSCGQKVVAGRFQRLRVLAHRVRIATGIVKRYERTDEHDGSFQQVFDWSPRRLTNRCRGVITTTTESSPRRT